MNENIDLTKILKNCPKGTEFYSSVHGKLKYLSMYVNSSASKISFEEPNSRSIIDGSPTVVHYYRNGRLYFTEGECVLFPSKDQRDWSKFKAPWYKKEKFGPKMLKPFDKVIGRDSADRIWQCDFFTYIGPGSFPYRCVGSSYTYCIPYNNETKHLVGTTEEAPEYYRYWEE